MMVSIETNLLLYHQQTRQAWTKTNHA